MSVLQGIKDPISGGPLEISKIIINKGHVIFSIQVRKSELDEYQKIRNHLGNVISKLTGVLKVSISLTEDKLHQTPQELRRKSLPGVAKVIVVASGKGGVGKSTIAANLAAALMKSGKKVALVDLDIYGPSLPSLFDINKKPVLDNNLMIPLIRFGIKLMSIGFLVKADEAVVWRGPMTTKMVYQLLQMTNWNFDGKNVDYMIIDTPPGTGDVHLSLYENYKVDGAVVISTPQALAEQDVEKGINMFNKFGIPIMGVVENMSYILDSNGKKNHVFGKSTAAKLAKRNKLKLLAELPIEPEMNNSAAKGKPMVIRKPAVEASESFVELATKITAQL